MAAKIAFLTRDLHYGGAERQLVNLAQLLNQRGFEVTVLLFYSGGSLEKDLISHGIRVVSLEKRGRWDISHFWGQLLQSLQQIQPHVLHGYLGTSNLLTIFLKPFLPKTKIVWGIRNAGGKRPGDDLLAGLLSQLEILLSNFADLIIFNSYAGQNAYLNRGFARNKTLVIPNGIDIERFQPNPEVRKRIRKEWGISEGTVLIGLIGRIVPIKDHSTFIRGAAKLCTERENVQFVCVGRGSSEYLESLHQLAHELGVSEKIIWSGERTDMPDIYNAIDITVSTSISEGFSNTLAEAMACGVPCIATAVGDSAQILAEDQGIVIPPRDPEALAVAMKQLINILTIGSRHPELIRQHIVTHFSMDELLLKTESALLNLL